MQVTDNGTPAGGWLRVYRRPIKMLDEWFIQNISNSGSQSNIEEFPFWESTLWPPHICSQATFYTPFRFFHNQIPLKSESS
jgi:hypothetical protein